MEKTIRTSAVFSQGPKELAVMIKGTGIEIRAGK
jgi:hypothetical protein